MCLANRVVVRCIYIKNGHHLQQRVLTPKVSAFEITLMLVNWLCDNWHLTMDTMEFSTLSKLGCPLLVHPTFKGFSKDRHFFHRTNFPQRFANIYISLYRITNNAWKEVMNHGSVWISSYVKKWILTHWGWDNMDAIFLIFSNVFLNENV